MDYRESWDLTSIPDDVWASEHGRRMRAKGPEATNIKLKPCKRCKKMLTARQRRTYCISCGKSQSE